jgi:hypothetical protein
MAYFYWLLALSKVKVAEALLYFCESPATIFWAKLYHAIVWHYWPQMALRHVAITSTYQSASPKLHDGVMSVHNFKLIHVMYSHPSGAHIRRKSSQHCPICHSVALISHICSDRCTSELIFTHCAIIFTPWRMGVSVSRVHVVLVICSKAYAGFRPAVVFSGADGNVRNTVGRVRLIVLFFYTSCHCIWMEIMHNVILRFSQFYQFHTHVSVSCWNYCTLITWSMDAATM